ncbi:unnamed protein product [Polarella glacialis]|uniref:Uncharacterized protein n=1 Tax=Polarella glacialis TaxID=89957 RepID=A0A813HZL1_POLGL|nr:unnamed protein product [Polarella glacialis]CAE8644603.1 unnamed protein product [Polarella glacialis]
MAMTRQALPIVCLFCQLSACLGAVVPDVVSTVTISSRQSLNAALEAGPNRRMGFLSEANFLSMHTVLSKKVEPVYFTDKEELYKAVTSENVLAALISGVPNKTMFSAFSSDLVSPRAFQMMPGSASDDLMHAVDAAVVRTHNGGDLVRVAEANHPFEVTEVHTCRSLEPAKVPFPDASTATGLLKDILDKKRLRVLAYGTPANKPDWKQDGNYEVDPPVGFWPEYMVAFMAEFHAAYGNDIQLERVWMTAGGTDMVLNGSIHMTEPYYIYESLHDGSLKKWSHKFSCIVMGYEQQFFSKRHAKVITDAVTSDAQCAAALKTCEDKRLMSRITSREELNSKIESGGNVKMGFLSQANFLSVQSMLSTKVEPVIFLSTGQLYEAVVNGSVRAALISGVPDRTNFTVFSTDVISPRAFQTMPGDRSVDLLRALDAVIVRTHNAGELLAAATANPPFQAVEVHTCRADNPSAVPFPAASTATGLLKDILENKKLRVLASGTPGNYPNWAQDGNYQATPMTGFWPDYMGFFMGRFRAEYGSDIVLERVWQTGTAGTEMVLNGTVHMTEPYYIYESLYKDQPKKWSHEFSCVVMGYQQNFFALKPAMDFTAAGPTCDYQLAACQGNTAQISAARSHQATFLLAGAVGLLLAMEGLLH